MNGRVDVIVILHGDPALPEWIVHEPRDFRLHLVVNDPGTRRYAALPSAASTYVNTTREGFASNVNAAVSRLLAEGDPGAFILANFDLRMDPREAGQVFRRLAERVTSGGAIAACGAQFRDDAGGPAFSAGRQPRAINEFLRAAGLRQGRLLELQRTALRHTPGWTARNSAESGARMLGGSEYLPWTCIAISTAAWGAVGPLDERFPLYAEDVDWGRRATSLGWQQVLVDVGLVTHLERATRSPTTDALYEASHARLCEKWELDRCRRAQSAGLRMRRLLAGPRTGSFDWDALTLASRPDFRMSMLRE